MPAKHRITTKGLVACAGPCGKEFAAERTHKQHLTYKEECRKLYPETYFPHPKVDKPAVEVATGAPVG